MSSPSREAQRFLEAWFETRRIVQSLNFNRFQQEGLSASQFILLELVGERGEASPADLARRLNVNVTTTMRTAESLVSRGLIARRPDAADRRRSVLALTEEGSAAHGRLRETFVRQVEAIFKAMAPERRSELVDGLEAFVAANENALRGP